MKLNTYKNYRTCPICNQTYPLIRDFFKRVNTHGLEAFHKICRNCEDKKKLEKEWHGNKLLCHNCHEYKDEECFSANASESKLRKYRRYVCRDCEVKNQTKLVLGLDDKGKLKRCLNFRYLSAKDRARKNKLDFNISLDYLVQLWDLQNGLCALSGIPMTYEFYNGRTPTNVSIDKTDRTKGYVIGNIQLVCMACNQMKSDLTEEDMYNFCKKTVEHYENKNKKDTTAA